MAPWRESVDKTAQADVDTLLNLALPLAVQRLTVSGRLHPFAAAIKDDGDHFLLGAETKPGAGEVESHAAIAECYDALTDQREDLRAAVVVSDVRLVGLEGDAIHLALEHSAGFALSLVQPYTLVRGKGVSLGPMSMVSGDRVTWPESAA
ncbi:hypothetical protein [Arthrobacter sp. YN]|uniref:hypothetical protein n=1 Tax=Arthrobacter sp. YN TaxID=2020486 RepID=UPI000B5E6F3A|nr:hypothetical protein [Arthrobacter sp. YN]ASN22196.1 hypothetical protein CGK93_22925 [Arthrobacter sp. YN]